MIRAATTTDAADIARIEHRAAAHPWTEDSVRSSLIRPVSAAWVTHVHGRCVGHLLSTVVLDEAEILTVAIDPELQRQGLGRALMVYAQAEWHRRQVQRAFLEVRRQNQAARSLYTRMGWTETGVRRNYYRDGEDAVLYLLELM